MYTRIHYTMNTSVILLLALKFRHLKAPKNIIAQIQISWVPILPRNSSRESLIYCTQIKIFVAIVLSNLHTTLVFVWIWKERSTKTDLSPFNHKLDQSATMAYSNVPNKRACTFISGKVCLLGSIKVRRQTLPEIIVHARLFGTLE